MRASGINRAFMQARSLSAAPVIAASIAAGIPLGSDGNAQSASGACAIALPASAPARIVAANSVLSIFSPSPTGPPYRIGIPLLFQCLFFVWPGCSSAALLRESPGGSHPHYLG